MASYYALHSTGLTWFGLVCCHIFKTPDKVCTYERCLYCISFYKNIKFDLSFKQAHKVEEIWNVIDLSAFWLILIYPSELCGNKQQNLVEKRRNLAINVWILPTKFSFHTSQLCVHVLHLFCKMMHKRANKGIRGQYIYAFFVVYFLISLTNQAVIVKFSVMSQRFSVNTHKANFVSQVITTMIMKPRIT
jgi:hypothetical protein